MCNYSYDSYNLKHLILVSIIVIFVLWDKYNFPYFYGTACGVLAWFLFNV